MENENLKTEQAKDNIVKPDVIKSYSPAVAKRLIAIREALLRNEMDEAFHQLYMIASPNCDKYSGEVWTEMEAIAGEYVL